jgi:hypothetical protein
MAFNGAEPDQFGAEFAAGRKARHIPTPNSTTNIKGKMKRLIQVIGVAAMLATVIPAGAQSTNLPAPPATSGVSNFLGGVEYVGGYAWDTFKQLDFSQGMEAQPFGFYIGNGDLGGGLEVNDIVTNNIVHLGFLVGGISEKQTDANGKTTRQSTWYCGSTSVSISGTVNQALGKTIPLVGNATVSQEAGPLVDLRNGTVYGQTFTKVGYRWDLGNGWDIGGDVGAGYISKYQSSVAGEANGSLVKHF